MKKLVVILICFHIGIVFSQEENKEEKIEQANRHIALGNQLLNKNGNFPLAEAEYRKAIAINPEDQTAKYNLGNAYYNSEKYDEATHRYSETAKIATSKLEKYRAFHNEGNSYMEQKKYKEAVESYKNSLRNNPKDDETRYNLALAKKMLEQQQKENEQNKDQDNKDNKENKDQQDQNKENEQNKEGENDKKDSKNEEGKNDKDKGEDKNEDKGDKKEEEGKPKEDKKEQGKDEKRDKEGEKEDNKGQQPKQIQGQLSPQQVKSLLEAMNNQEKKVQDKINAKKVKGAKTRTDKDW